MIPVNEPLIGKKELEYTVEAIKSGWISSEGAFIKEFEEKFSCYIGKKYGVAVNSGTNALIAALRVLELPEGSEVIIPSFTIISCALACIYNNLIPIFVDSEEETWNMDTSAIADKITKKTRAIMAVHTYGHPVDMDAIAKISKKYNLYVIEDFAEAIGSEYKGIKCGNFGELSCVSFYANKAVTTGEGGMCLTNNFKLAEKLRRIKNLGFIPAKRFIHHELGFNFRMTNIQAAIGVAQLEKIKAHIRKKIWIGRTYTKLLKNMENKGFVRLPIQKEWAKNTYWMYGILLDEALSITAETAMNRLTAGGIQTRPFFYPLHKQPAFKKLLWYKAKTLPVSEKLYEYGFYIPSGLTLTEEKIYRVAEYLKKVIA